MMDGWMDGDDVQATDIRWGLYCYTATECNYPSTVARAVYYYSVRGHVAVGHVYSSVV